MNNNNNWIFIGAIIVIALLFGVFVWPGVDFDTETNTNNNEMVTSTIPQEQTNNVDDVDGEDETAIVALTSVDEIISFQNNENIATKEDMNVILDDVEVISVPSDKVFFVGTSEQNIPVLLDEDLSPSSEIEGQVNIIAGQRVSFSGFTKLVPDQAEILNLLGITQGDADALLGNEMYIFVQGTSVEILEQPEQQ